VCLVKKQCNHFGHLGRVDDTDTAGTAREPGQRAWLAELKDGPETLGSGAHEKVLATAAVAEPYNLPLPP